MSNANLPSWLQGADVLDEPAPAPSQAMFSSMDDTPARPARPSMEVHTPFVVRQLGKNVPPSDIIMALVEKYNCPWDDAERFVSGVSIQHHDKIQGQQRPLFIFITVVTLVGGLLLFAYSGLRLYDGDFGRLVLSMQGTGFLMITGGLYGVYQLVRDIAKG